MKNKMSEKTLSRRDKNRSNHDDFIKLIGTYNIFKKNGNLCCFIDDAVDVHAKICENRSRKTDCAGKDFDFGSDELKCTNPDCQDKGACARSHREVLGRMRKALKERHASKKLIWETECQADTMLTAMLESEMGGLTYALELINNESPRCPDGTILE